MKKQTQAKKKNAKAEQKQDVFWKYLAIAVIAVFLFLSFFDITPKSSQVQAPTKQVQPTTQSAPPAQQPLQNGGCGV